MAKKRASGPREPCPECGKMMSAGAGMATHRRLVHMVTKEAASPAASPDAAFEDEKSPGDSPFVTDEQVPGQPQGTKAKKWFQRGGADKDATKPIKPRIHHPRVNTAGFFTEAWTGVGNLVVRSDVPVGRVLLFQAPCVGDIIDEEISGTAADKLIQPVVRWWEKGSTIGALVGVPIVVAMIERQPERQALLVPMLRSMMGPMLVQMAKGAKKAKKRQEAEMAAIEDLDDFLPPEMVAEMKRTNKSPADFLIEMIFADMPTPTPETVP